MLHGERRGRSFDHTHPTFIGFPLFLHTFAPSRKSGKCCSGVIGQGEVGKACLSAANIPERVRDGKSAPSSSSRPIMVMLVKFPLAALSPALDQTKTVSTLHEQRGHSGGLIFAQWCAVFCQSSGRGISYAAPNASLECMNYCSINGLENAAPDHVSATNLSVGGEKPKCASGLQCKSQLLQCMRR